MTDISLNIIFRNKATVPLDLNNICIICLKSKHFGKTVIHFILQLLSPLYTCWQSKPFDFSYSGCLLDFFAPPLGRPMYQIERNQQTVVCISCKAIWGQEISTALAMKPAKITQDGKKQAIFMEILNIQCIKITMNWWSLNFFKCI